MLKIVSQWSYNPPSGLWLLGTDAKDSSGNGDDGTAHGGVTFGQAGPTAGTKATLFDGTTGYVSASNAGLRIRTQPFTVCMWINAAPPASHGQSYYNVFSQPGNTYIDWQLFVNSAADWGLFFTADGVSTISADSIAANVVNNAWHLLAAIVDRVSPIVLLQDGVRIPSLNFGGSGVGVDLASTSALQIGNLIPDDPSGLTGLGAGAFLIEKALTTAQVQAIYNIGPAMSDYYRFASLIIRLDSNGRVYVGSTSDGDQYVLSVAQQLNMNQVTAQVSGIVELQGGNQFTKTQFDAACQSLAVPSGLILTHDIG